MRIAEGTGRDDTLAGEVLAIRLIKECCGAPSIPNAASCAKGAAIRREISCYKCGVMMFGNIATTGVSLSLISQQLATR
jgi:hypothetical protein